jgi:hypothetical protein
LSGRKYRLRAASAEVELGWGWEAGSEGEIRETQKVEKQSFSDKFERSEWIDSKIPKRGASIDPAWPQPVGDVFRS